MAKNDWLKDIFSNLVLSNLADFIKSTIKNFQDAIYHTTRKVIESMLTLFLLIAGICMVIVSLPFLLSYYLDLPASLFFILIGVLLILMALFSFDKIHKTKYKN